MYMKIIALLTVFGVTQLAHGVDEAIVLKSEHPTRYAVKSGDTLWDISARFLRDPWRWPDIWVVNPQIANPHLIYPGDEVVLTYKDGRPQLELRRGAEPTAGPRTVKLEPQIRVLPSTGAIPTLSIEAITPFLTRPSVMSERELEDLPYIASLDDEHLIGGSGGRVYARSLEANDNLRYRIIRRGVDYREPRDNKFVGIEIIDVADAVAERYGDPSTLRITRAQREIRIGDRIIPATGGGKTDFNFLPRAPEFAVDANIIGVIGGMSRIGQYQVVAVSIGKQHKIEAGHVLAVYSAPQRVKDRVGEAKGPSKFTLPDRRAGYVVVFRPFDKMSYALVMVAEHEMRVLDDVRTP
ncbi:MAG: LysM domain-containing protein [Pseudomonadota bacterium]